MPTGWIYVAVLEARNLKKKGGKGTRNAYVDVSLGKVKHQTHVIWKTLTPVWLQTGFSFALESHESQFVDVVVWDRNIAWSDTFIGYVRSHSAEGRKRQRFEVSIKVNASEKTARTKEKWFPLMKKGKCFGEIHLKLRYISDEDYRSRDVHELLAEVHGDANTEIEGEGVVEEAVPLKDNLLCSVNEFLGRRVKETAGDQTRKLKDGTVYAAKAAGKKVEQGVKTTKEKVREARLEKLAEKQRALSVRGAAVVKQGVLYKLGGTIKIWKKGFWVLVAEPDLELRRFDSMSCAKLEASIGLRAIKGIQRLESSSEKSVHQRCPIPERPVRSASGIDHCTAIVGPGSSFSFALEFEWRSVVFAGATTADMEEWYSKIVDLWDRAQKICEEDDGAQLEDDLDADDLEIEDMYEEDYDRSEADVALVDEEMEDRRNTVMMDFSNLEASFDQFREEEEAAQWGGDGEGEAGGAGAGAGAGSFRSAPPIPSRPGAMSPPPAHRPAPPVAAPPPQTGPDAPPIPARPSNMPRMAQSIYNPETFDPTECGEIPDAARGATREHSHGTVSMVGDYLTEDQLAIAPAGLVQKAAPPPRPSKPSGGADAYAPPIPAKPKLPPRPGGGEGGGGGEEGWGSGESMIASDGLEIENSGADAPIAPPAPAPAVPPKPKSTSSEALVSPRSFAVVEEPAFVEEPAVVERPAAVMQPPSAVVPSASPPCVPLRPNQEDSFDLVSSEEAPASVIESEEWAQEATEDAAVLSHSAESVDGGGGDAEEHVAFHAVDDGAGERQIPPPAALPAPPAAALAKGPPPARPPKPSRQVSPPTEHVRANGLDAGQEEEAGAPAASPAMEAPAPAIVGSPPVDHASPSQPATAPPPVTALPPVSEEPPASFAAAVGVQQPPAGALGPPPAGHTPPPTRSAPPPGRIAPPGRGSPASRRGGPRGGRVRRGVPQRLGSHGSLMRTESAPAIHQSPKRRAPPARNRGGASSSEQIKSPPTRPARSPSPDGPSSSPASEFDSVARPPPARSAPPPPSRSQRPQFASTDSPARPRREVSRGTASPRARGRGRGRGRARPVLIPMNSAPGELVRDHDVGSSDDHVAVAPEDSAGNAASADESLEGADASDVQHSGGSEDEVEKKNLRRVRCSTLGGGGGLRPVRVPNRGGGQRRGTRGARGRGRGKEMSEFERRRKAMGRQ